MSDDICTSGYHAFHGAFINPGLRGNSPATGNGDYREWIEYEAEQANREAERERNERFAPFQTWEPVDEPPAEQEPEPDYELSWMDRWRIAIAVDDEVKRQPGETWQQHLGRQTEAAHCTAFAEAFRRWVDAGCPIKKGKA